MSINIPVGVAPSKNEVMGEYSFSVTAATIQDATVSTIKLTFTLKISDPDCEAPATVLPGLDTGVAYTSHALLAE
jgi:hypothetical protein